MKDGRSDMLRRIDRSKRLGRLLDGLSGGVAKRRGLPIVIGILLVVVALVVELIAELTGSRALDIIGTILNSVGVLFALIGLAVAAPLGR
jgi:hypothetical protein